MKSVKPNTLSHGKGIMTSIQRSIKERLAGEAALEIRDLATAELNFRQAINLNPHCVECQLDLAWTFYHQGEHRKANTLVEYLLDQDKYPKGSLHLKALLLCLEERYTEAEDAYLQALRDDHTLKDAELENTIWGLI